MIRLNKYISDAGICSRRKADEHILAGDVTVNGVVSSELGVRIDPDQDIVEFQGKVVRSDTEFVYYVLNKPKGVVSTASDENGQKTVIDLVPKNPRVYPVGRLDKDTVGLIILTNDGDLTKELTHPSYGHQKKYEVWVQISKTIVRNKSEIEKFIVQKLKAGLLIDGKPMKADSAEFTLRTSNSGVLTITIHTGYNRQVRKMCAKIGLEVTRLTRIGLGKLELSSLDLKMGEYKKITKAEII